MFLKRFIARKRTWNKY